MTNLEDEVREQFAKFEAELPALIAAHGGKWAVYLDGLKSVQDSEIAALKWAQRNVDGSRGYVVAPIETPEPIWVAARHAWGIP